MSFIKLNDQIHSEFFTVAEEDCNDAIGIDGGGQITVRADTQSWPKEIFLFKSNKEAGQYAREYWEECIHGDRETAIEILGAETLLSWAFGEAAGPGSVKTKNLEEWLDLYLDAPDEHFEEEFSVDAIGSNIIEILGFKPTVAYSMG